MSVRNMAMSWRDTLLLSRKKKYPGKGKEKSMIYTQTRLPAIRIRTFTCIRNKPILCVCIQKERSTHYICIEVHINVSNLILWRKNKNCKHEIRSFSFIQKINSVPVKWWLTGNSAVTFWFCNLKGAKKNISVWQNWKFLQETNYSYIPVFPKVRVSYMKFDCKEAKQISMKTCKSAKCLAKPWVRQEKNWKPLSKSQFKMVIFLELWLVLIRTYKNFSNV